MKRLFLVASFVIGLSALVACGSNVAADDLSISAVKANLTLPTETGAVYLTITNNTAEDERLTGATVPGCDVIELHEMSMKDDVMVMRQVEGGEIIIPAGETVELKQGGMHIMCIGKSGEFAVGDTIDMTLEFANAGEIELTADVIAPGGMNVGGEGMQEGDG